jgi:hypothetical protein
MVEPRLGAGRADRGQSGGSGPCPDGTDVTAIAPFETLTAQDDKILPTIKFDKP